MTSANIKSAVIVTMSLSVLSILLALLLYITEINTKTYVPDGTLSKTFWEFQSIDTMKYSRDVARQKINDKQFEQTINTQTKNIAETGATHIAIATPYDEEFFPFLKKWVDAARENGLKVWFRGNWSGWEGWFEYPKITREEHINKSVAFIKEHNTIFESGDIFSPCPECENGGPGDPRHNKELEKHREFLIQEYIETTKAFRDAGKNVRTNFNPMNGDVAKLVMNKETTRALGGIVVIDHYVKSPEKLAQDIKSIAENSGGKIVLGEFGAPIPDIHGNFSPGQQADWIEEAFALISYIPELKGINYWVGVGGTTELWDGKNNPKPAVEIVKKYFTPIVSSVLVYNEIEQPLKNAAVTLGSRTLTSDDDGYVQILYSEENPEAEIRAEGYKTAEVILDSDKIQKFVLVKSFEDFSFRLQKLLVKLLGSNR